MKSKNKINRVYHEECPKSNRFLMFPPLRGCQKLTTDHFHMFSMHWEGYGPLWSGASRICCHASFPEHCINVWWGRSGSLFPWIKVFKLQGPVPVPQKPPEILFPGFVLFSVIHMLGITVSEIAHHMLWCWAFCFRYQVHEPLISP